MGAGKTAFCQALSFLAMIKVNKSNIGSSPFLFILLPIRLECCCELSSYVSLSPPWANVGQRHQSPITVKAGQLHYRLLPCHQCFDYSCSEI